MASPHTRSRRCAITSIFLAESQLKMNKADLALATLESARSSIEQIDNDLVMVEFRRILGMVHLALGQLPQAEQECQKGIEIAERYLSTLKTPTHQMGLCCRKGLVSLFCGLTL